MKVFGIGLSKTGTKTLGACLRELGFEHFGWDRRFAERVVVHGDVEALERAAASFESFDDIPWPLYYRRLDELYPEARFILTLRRSPEEWYESMLRHAEYKGATEVRRLVYGHAVPHGHRAGHVAVYQRHRREVEEHFADRPGKLLEVCWQVDPSWDRLCGFLGRPAPDAPFPHANKRRSEAPLRRLARRVGFTARGYADRLLSR